MGKAFVFPKHGPNGRVQKHMNHVKNVWTICTMGTHKKTILGGYDPYFLGLKVFMCPWFWGSKGAYTSHISQVHSQVEMQEISP